MPGGGASADRGQQPSGATVKWFGASASAAPVAASSEGRRGRDPGPRLPVPLGAPGDLVAGRAQGLTDQHRRGPRSARPRCSGIDRQNRLLDDLQSDEAVAQARSPAPPPSSTASTPTRPRSARRSSRRRTPSPGPGPPRRARRTSSASSTGRCAPGAGDRAGRRRSSTRGARRWAPASPRPTGPRTRACWSRSSTAESFTDVLSDASAYLAYGDQDAAAGPGASRRPAALDSLRAVTAATRYRTDQLRRDAQAPRPSCTTRRRARPRPRRSSTELEAQDRRRPRQPARRVPQDRRNSAKQQALVRRQQAAPSASWTRRSPAWSRRRSARAARRAERHAARRQRWRRRRWRPGERQRRFSWPTSGIVTQEFGCTGFPLEPPRGSCPHFHDGIDIANGTGTPVRAAGDGVVAFVGWNPYDGSDPSFMVVIGHAGGLETLLLAPPAALRRAHRPIRHARASSSATWATPATPPGPTSTGRSSAATRPSTRAPV